MRRQVRDSVTEAVAEAPGKCSLRPDMEAVVETMVKDIARDLVTVRMQSTPIDAIVNCHVRGRRCRGYQTTYGLRVLSHVTAQGLKRGITIFFVPCL